MSCVRSHHHWMDINVILIFTVFSISVIVFFFVVSNKEAQKEKNDLIEKTKLKPSPEAFLKLGDLAVSGDDEESAMVYYVKAVSMGSALACRRLNGIYLGRGVMEKAFEYELKAAELGDHASMLLVSGSYKEGKGVLKNIGKSSYWLLRSAEAGNAQSMAEVAVAYIEGYGLTENPMEGLAWLYVAEYKQNDDAAKLIKNAEAKLNNSLILMAQDRAKVIIDLIQDGRRTTDSTLGAPAPNSPPGQKAPSKPKHEAKGSGSGAIVSSLGHVVTAAHVIKGSNYLEIVTPAGSYPATVLSVDDANDVALLKVDKSFEAHIPVGRSNEVRLGQSVATIGFPNIGIQGHSPKVTQGMISGENGMQNDIRMWQISVPIQPGNSGGPLLDEHGRLVGVVVASLSLRAIQITGSVPQNVNYAIKGAYLEPLLNFHKVPMAQSATLVPGSFQDMVAVVQKASVLILVY